MSSEYDDAIESESTALVRVVSEGDPNAMLAVLEKKAELAGRMRMAIETIVVSQTYPEDWHTEGEGDKAKACLNSAGAERIARNFPIRYSDVKHTKEEFSDALGNGYRYVYTGMASMYDREVYAEGRYSTRDKFLGKAHGEYRPPEDINEGDVRTAAYHTFLGNAIKELLGLRGMPAVEYQRIMQSTGRDAAKSSNVTRGKGTQGGTSGDDARHQTELTELCMGFANDGYSVESDSDGNWSLRPLSDSDSRDSVDVAKDICVQLSSFTGEGGKKVSGKLSKSLTGKWLSATLSKARKLKESQPANADTFPGE